MFEADTTHKTEGSVPNPEVSSKTPRRRFTAAYKQRILEEADACQEPGEIGALLRREGIYSSYLANWRNQRRQGTLSGSSEKKRGPKSNNNSELQDELERLKRENARLKQQLDKAETIIDVQKKLSTLLGVMMPETEDKDN